MREVICTFVSIRVNVIITIISLTIGKNSRITLVRMMGVRAFYIDGVVGSSILNPVASITRRCFSIDTTSSMATGRLIYHDLIGGE